MIRYNLIHRYAIAGFYLRRCLYQSAFLSLCTPRLTTCLAKFKKQRKAESCFGFQEIFWVKNLFLISGIPCEKVCGIINDVNSLTLVAEATKLLVSLKLALLEVRDPIQPNFYSPVEFLEYSKNLVDQVAGGCCCECLVWHRTQDMLCA